MCVRETTVFEEETTHKLFIEVKSADKGLHMAQRQLVIHQAELSVDNFCE